MKLKHNITFRLLVTTLTINFCQAASIPEKNDLSLMSTIPGSGNEWVVLGQAFNSNSQHLTSSVCVTGETRNKTGVINQSFIFSKNMKATQMAEYLTGSIDAGINFKLAAASADYSFVKSTASNDLTTNYTFIYQLNGGKKALVPPTDTGKYNDTCNTPNVAYGDEFVSAIEYSAYLNVNVTFSYSSIKDKELLEGNLAVSFSSFEINGDLSSDVTAAAGRTVVSLNARQRGGSPGNLISVMTAASDTCSLTDSNGLNMSECNNALDIISDYATQDSLALNGYDITTFPQQFRTDDYSNYSIEAILTSVYTEAGLNNLPAKPTLIGFSAQLDKQALLELKNQFNSNISNISLGNNILKKDPYNAVVLANIRKAEENVDLIVSLDTYCHSVKNTPGLCYDNFIINESNIRSIDMTDQY